VAAPCARLQLVRGPVRIGSGGRPFNAIVRRHFVRIKSTSALAVLMAVSSGAAAQAPSVTAPFPESVSIVQLIARPEKFHGRIIQVTGFCNFQFEGNAVYLHSEDYSNHNSKNGVWVNLPDPPPKFSRGPCLIFGRFDASQHGHRGHYSGLIQASQVSEWLAR
jgi:hypothetical protein